MLPVAVVSGIGAVLVWVLWALPVADSLGEATPVPLGTPVSVVLSEGERAGLWMNSPAEALGTYRCDVQGPRGRAVPTAQPPALEWSDVLWWASDRPMFAQVLGFAAASPGEYTVTCVERTGSYGGDVLLARNSFGAGTIGLGRTGGADFAVGSLLAFCAVVLPLLSGLLFVMSGCTAVVRAFRRIGRGARPGGEPTR